MHGVLGAAVQNYVCTEHGLTCWNKTALAADVPGLRFEPMLHYGEHLLQNVLNELALHLDRDCDDILEDLGTFLVTSKEMLWLPRLLRFGGFNFADFLRQLPQVPQRVALAAFDFGLPKLHMENHPEGFFELRVSAGLPQWPSILVGLLRSMGDQYGTLCAVTHIDKTTLRIDIFDAQHAKPTSFNFCPVERV